MADPLVFERLNIANRADRVRLQLGWHHAPTDPPLPMAALVSAELRQIAAMIEAPSPDNTGGRVSLRVPGSQGRVYLRFQMPPDLALTDLIAFLHQAADALPALIERVQYAATPWSPTDEQAWENPVPTIFLNNGRMERAPGDTDSGE